MSVSPTSLPKSKIVISGCLLGDEVRYDAGHKQILHAKMDYWREHDAIVNVCPELMGGFGIPRPPAEIVGGTAEDVFEGNAKVMDTQGADVTQMYINGARKAAKHALAKGCQFALLKEGSPTCGSSRIYTGKFNSSTMPGHGVFAALLKAQGLYVFSDEQIENVPIDLDPSKM